MDIMKICFPEPYFFLGGGILNFCYFIKTMKRRRTEGGRVDIRSLPIFEIISGMLPSRQPDSNPTELNIDDKRPVYILVFRVYNSKQVNVSGIQIFRAQFLTISALILKMIKSFCIFFQQCSLLTAVHQAYMFG